MKHLTVTLLVIGSIAITPLANAADVESVCAKYKKSFNKWSDSYKVEATLVDGSDLNRKTSCYNCYEPYSKYAAIFWGNGGTTVIELDSRYFSYSGNKGFDQNGRFWELSRASYTCY